MRLLLTLMASLLLSSQAVADYAIILDGTARILNNHPRILVNESDLANLRAKTTDNPVYDNMIADAVSYMTTYWDSTLHTWTSGKSCADMPWSVAPDGVLGSFVSMGMYYQMYPNGTLNSVPAVEYANFAKQMMLDLANDACGYNDNEPWGSNPNRDYGSIHLFYLARVYDLIYNVDGDALLSGDSSFLDTFFTWINDVMFPMVESHEEYIALGSDPATLLPEANLMLTAMRGRAAMALASYEDNELADGRGDAIHNSEYYLEGSWDYLEDQLIPFKNTVMQGGHGTDGGEYHTNRTAFYTLAIMEVFRTATTDLNPFFLTTGSWVDEQIDFDIYRSLPDPTNMYVEGTFGEYSINDWARQFTDVAFFSGRYATDSAKRGRDFLKKTFAPYTNYAEISPHYAADWFLYYDNDGAVVDYTALPESIFTHGSDLFISRTGWGSDDIFLEFRAAETISMYTRGDLAHTGSYTIYGNEPLIINNIADTNLATSNGAPEHYNINTVSHSVTSYYGGNLSCPGGMYRYASVYDVPVTEFGRANITTTIVGTTPMRYAKADLTGAYLDITTGGGGGGKVVDSAYRSVVHSAETTGESYIIVHDIINQHESGDMVSQIHYAGDPTISGQKISWAGSVSKIETNVLIPTANITKTDVTDTLSTNIKAAVSEINAVRVNIPLGSTGTANVLVVHSPSNDLDAVLPNMSLLSGATFEGVLIDDQTVNRVVLFSNSSASQSTITITPTTTTDNIRVFAADFAINTDITITRDGVEIAESPINSGPDGAVDFTALGGSVQYIIASGTPPTCSDLIQNGDETGVDCGGSCPACSPPGPWQQAAFTFGTAPMNFIEETP